MWRAWPLLPLALALLTGCFVGTDPPGVEEPAPLEPGNNVIVIQHDGVDRRAVLHVPAGLPAGPVPLMVVLHPGASNGRATQDFYGFDAHAAQHGFLVLYPNGTGAGGQASPFLTWNAAHCCGPAHQRQVDDLGYLEALIHHVTGLKPIHGVAVAGHSNGAMMALRLAAERGDLVDAVVSVAGTIGGQRDAATPESRVPPPDPVVPLLLIHARDDPNVPYEGGMGTAGLDPGRIDLSVDDSIGHWRQAAELTGPALTWNEGVVEYRKWTGNGTEVTLVATEGGHGWPGGPAGNAFIQTPASPDATALAVDFLLRHRGVAS